MWIIKSIIVTLVGLGLVLSPIAAANAMATVPTALMDGVGSGPMSSVDKACPCCDMAGKCTMATCTMNCVQFGPASQSTVEVARDGHAALSATVPALNQGLAPRPPTPPPRD